MSTIKSRLGSRFDVNRNGDLSPEEVAAAKEILALELQEEKAETQRRMAWTAIGSMIVFTVALFSPLLADSRVKALSDLFSLFYLAQAGIVGAFMGVTTWMSNSRVDSYSSYSYEESHGKYGATD